MMDHDKKFVAFLERCQAVGIQLNPRKLRLKLSQVRIMDNFVRYKIVLPDPEKVTTIRNMLAPTHLQGVYRL